VRVADHPQRSIQYCKKDGDYHERGIAPKTQQEKGILGAKVVHIHSL
jgi:hypothetical protein